MRKLFSLLLCCLFCITLTGCGSKIPFTWSLSRVPNNLDPQLAIESPELIAVTNMYSGLVRLDEEGTPQLDCAESVDVSANGLVYTFAIKKGLEYNQLKWQTETYTLTAHDFVFALQRVYRSETKSPYVSTFSGIVNSEAVLAGQMPERQLGVKALDDYTLEITLHKADNHFLEKLALPGAMPCNKDFFESTAGAYGLSRKNTLANGSFSVYNWNTNGLFLRRDDAGRSVTSLRLVLDTTATAASSDPNAVATTLSGEEKLQSGYTTAALHEGVPSGNYPAIEYTARTWVLVFNCENEYLAQADVRRALAVIARSTPLALPSDLTPADGFIPPAITLDGESYRERAGAVTLTAEDAAALCRAGLAAGDKTQFSNISILMPQDEAGTALTGSINQQWQKQLGAFAAYFPIKQLPLSELQAQVAAGNFQIALLPITATVDSPVQLLQQTKAARLASDEFSSALSALSSGAKLNLNDVKQLEELVIDDAAVCPLWFQTQYLVTSPGVKGLIFRPFGPVLDLSFATITE